MDTTLRITLLGGLFIEQNGQPVTGLKTQKEALLLAYLAVAQRPFTRETIADLLWPERDQAQAMSNLRTLLTRMRKAVGAYVQIERQTVAIVPDRIWVDVLAFAAQVQAVPGEALSAEDVLALETAVSLYQGDFLAGVTITDSQGLENWQLLTAERLRSQAIQARRQLATYYYNKRQSDKGILHARAYTEMDPLREDGHRLLMRLLVRDGQINAALGQYQRCAAILAAELGVAPAPETEALYQRLQTARAAPPPFLLPVQPTHFVGRQVELDVIQQYLDAENGRLLTILGAGGVGKTRLAVQAAQLRKGDYLHGIVFVPLESIDTAVQLAIKIGQTLGLQFGRERSPQSQMLRYLQNKEMLLILDNIEQLLSDPETILFLQNLMIEAADLKVVVTSRERLRLRWERVVPVRGLPYPAESFGDVSAYAAIRLFEQCAAWQGMADVAQHVDEMVQLCALVEGLPLGIELAVATLEKYSPAQAIEKLQETLDVLATTMHDVPARHRSMRAVFEYSWQLLQANEQLVLAQLSIFSGGAQETAVLTITQATLPILKALVDKSLIRKSDDDRYTMHSLITQFAQEKLENNPQTAQLRQKHAAYYLNQIKEQGVLLYTSQYTTLLPQLQQEYANILQAWAWATQHKAFELLRGASCGFVEYFVQTDLYQEGFDLFTRTIAELPNVAHEHPVISSLMCSQVRVLRFLGDYQRCIRIIKEALQLAQALNAAEEEVRTRMRYGDLLLHLSRYEEALTQYETVSTKAEISKFPMQEAASYRSRGLVLSRLGKLAEAEKYGLQALQLYKEFDGRHGYVLTLRNLSRVYAAMGQVDVAQDMLEEAVGLAQQRSPMHRAIIQSDLGIIYCRRYKYAAALKIFTNKLAIAQEYGLYTSEGLERMHVGNVYRDLGCYDTAHEHYQQAHAIFQKVGEKNFIGQIQLELGISYSAQALYKKAADAFAEAWQVSESTGARINQRKALTFLGLTQIELKQWPEAQSCLEKALDLYGTLAGEPEISSVRLGLAKLAWEQHDEERAVQELTAVLSHLLSTERSTSVYPVWHFWWAYQLLRVMKDPRAAAILQTAQAQLQERAAQIDDMKMRQTFLHQVPMHEKILGETAVFK